MHWKEPSDLILVRMCNNKLKQKDTSIKATVFTAPLFRAKHRQSVLNKSAFHSQSLILMVVESGENLALLITPSMFMIKADIFR